MGKSFGFGSTAGGASQAEFEQKLVTDRDLNDPNRKEDLELGIDRSLVEPIKFVSSIDSKPIYPPYLQLADFDSYLKRDQEGNQNQVAGPGDKKKDGNVSLCRFSNMLYYQQ